jgi:hypothetical protein
VTSARSRLLVAAAIAVLWLSPAESRRPKPTPCAGGRYVFDAGQLIVGNGSLLADAIDLETKQISLGGCPLARPHVKATRTGTKVRATWTKCSAVKGKVTLNAIVATGCQHMTGRIKIPKRKPARFSATLLPCGDGVVQPELGEECEGDETCGPGTRCTLACRCRGTGGAGGTTTTTLPPPGLSIRWNVPPPSIVDSGEEFPLELEVAGCGKAVEGDVLACPIDQPLNECLGSGDFTIAPAAGHFAGAPGTFSFTARGSQCGGVADYNLVASVSIADGAGNFFGPFVAAPMPTRLRPAGSVLDADVDALAFATLTGGTPAPQSLFLFSECGEAFPFTVSASAAWLKVTPASATLDQDGTAELTVAVDPAGVAGGGPFTATLTITSGATSVPLTIPVRLDVVTASAVWAFPAPAEVASGAPFDLALDVSGDFRSVDGDVVACTTDVAIEDCFDAGPFDFESDAGHFTGPPGRFTFQPRGFDCEAPEDLNLSVRFTVTDAGGNVLGPFLGNVTTTRLLAPPGPVLAADPDLLTLSAIGGTPVSETLTLFTICGEQVRFTGATTDAPWLSVTPATGTVDPDNGADVTVRVNPAGLDPAASPFQASIAIPSTATNSPLVVPVKLDLAGGLDVHWSTPAPATLASNQPFSLVLQVNGPATNVEGDVVACTTDVPLAECFDAGPFEVAPFGGHFIGPPGTFVFSVRGFDCDGPERFNLAARILLPGSDGDFTVGPFLGLPTATTLRAPGGPFLVIDPPSLLFNAVVGQSPPSQFLSLTSACGQALSWRGIDASAPWLSATPKAGPIPAGDLAEVRVTLDPAGLDAAATPLGATLSFTAPATNGPVAVPVTVNLLDCGR